jgi:pantoate--beta-alanine ligase
MMANLTKATTASSFRDLLSRARSRGASVGFVPTMGALHEGHCALVDEARRRCDFVAVSVFVNPTQFAPGEDFARYPRNVERDEGVCRQAGVDVLFVPSVGEMYPDGDDTKISAGALAEVMCGPLRPGHFEGVATVVTKLLALAGPCTAVFGRKDYQQLQIIKRIVTDLHLPVAVVGHPIVRDSDGLAKSSRNVYLSPDERRRALAIPRALARAARAFSEGERRVEVLLRGAHQLLDPAASSIDYVTVAHPTNLKPLAPEGCVEGTALLAVAMRVGATRLIDNIVLGEDPAPLTESNGRWSAPNQSNPASEAQ